MMSYNQARLRLRSITICIFLVIATFIFFESTARLSDIAKKHRRPVKHGISVFCFGDDMTFGDGVSPGKTYPAELEKALNRVAGRDRFSVVNFGALEFNSSQILKYLEYQIRLHPADYVIILAGKNNINNLTDSNYFLLKKKNKYSINAAINFNYWKGKIRTLGLFDVWAGKFRGAFRINKARVPEWGYPGQGQDKLIGKEFLRYRQREPVDIQVQQSMRLRELKLIAFADKEKNLGRQNLAAAYWKEAASLNPTNIWAFNELGLIYKNMGMPGLARECFSKAIAMSPNHSRAHIELALIDYPTEKLYALPMRKRLELAYEAIECRPGSNKDYYIYMEEAWFLKIFGRYEQALSKLGKAAELNPFCGRIFFERGLLLEKMNKDEAAIAEFRKAIGINPADHRSRFRLGILLRKTGEHALSLQELIKASSANIFNADYHFELAMAYGLVNDRQLKEEELEKAIYLKPCSYPAYLELAGMSEESDEKAALIENKENAEKYLSLMEYDLSSMIGFLKARGIGIIMLTYPEEVSNGYPGRINSIIIDMGRKFSVPVFTYGSEKIKAYLTDVFNLNDNNGQER